MKSTPEQPESDISTPSRSATLASELRGSLESATPQPEVLSDEENTERNRSLLQGETDTVKSLLNYYDAMIKRFPALKEVAIVQRPKGKGGASARTKFSRQNQSGRHEVSLNLDPDSEQIIMDELLDRPATLATIAEKLDLQPYQITPQKAQAFVMLHEMGHALEYTQTVQTEPRQAARAEQRKK